MGYLDVSEFIFNNEPLRGFSISCIDNVRLDINDIQVTFQKNRAIVFNIIIDNIELIKYLNKDRTLNKIQGKYYHYNFVATIDNYKNIEVHPPFCTYNIIIDLIEFSKKDFFSIDSNDKFKLQIIPTQNMLKYMKRIKKETLFNFEDITYVEYNSRLRYLLELNSLIYDTPILIEYLTISKGTIQNFMFQSQNINEHTINRLDDSFQMYSNSHYISNLEKYLSNFILFRKSEHLINLLLKTYFINHMYLGKEHFNLNDISGFIDLFDGIFINLKIEKENLNDTKSQREKVSNNSNLKSKIDYILETLDSSLKLYEIDKSNLSQTLSNFRNMVRHQKAFKKYDLNKLLTFSQGVLKLYIIKHILKVSNDDYDMDRILSNFNIYPLIEHKYNYKGNEIIVYNTKLDNYGHNKLVENSTYYNTLISYEKFKKVQPNEFIYDETYTKEIKKIYIDDYDTIRRALIFFGIIIVDNKILQEDRPTYRLNLTYDELKKNLLNK